MIYNYDDYRAYLKDSLQKTIEKNPLFSLRAMAKQMSISASTLSSVITGKRNLSAEMAVKIAKVLKLNARHTDYLLALVQLENARTAELKAVLRKKVETMATNRKVKIMNAELFSAISEWHHAAILELTSIQALKASDKYKIATDLSISATEVEAAIERLRKLDLLRENDEGYLIKCDSEVVVSSTIPNKALRAYHRAMLQKASDSLETQEPHERLIGSETFAISESDLEKIEALMEDFFTQSKAVGTSSEKADRLYYLGVQFFRLNRASSNQSSDQRKVLN